MNIQKKQNFGQSKFNSQWWQKKFIWTFIITLGIINFGCEKEVPNSNVDNNTNNDEYYVKYVVTSSSIYSVSRTAQINSENNSKSSYTFSNSPWEVTIGPVKKGFNASLNANINTSQILAKTYINVEIQVSKNNAPFALKASNNSTEVRNLASTSYTLN
jgi:hypothetical protein